MNIVVDTSVWSLVLRRRRVDDTNPFVRAFRQHVEQGDGVHLVGCILQEVLDGVATDSDFERLERLLRSFPLIPLTRETYTNASRLRNQCRRKGIQASAIDYLITAACLENGYPLLTSDHDFLRIADHCQLNLIPA